MESIYLNSFIIEISPIKEKYVRCNRSPFVNKHLRKAIMTRTCLLNKYRKHNSAENLFAYITQRNLFLQKFFNNNPNVKRITDTRIFW